LQNIVSRLRFPEEAAHDPRFQFFHELPEDSYEAFPLRSA
jgi:signal transduction protein with GAF and PtsI domain